MLMELARDQADPKARKKAIFWLGQSGDEGALDLIKEVVMQPNDTETVKAAPSRARHPAPRLRTVGWLRPRPLRLSFGVTRSSGSASAARRRRWTT